MWKEDCFHYSSSCRLNSCITINPSNSLYLIPSGIINNIRLVPAPFLGQIPVNPVTCSLDANNIFVCAPGRVLLGDNTGQEIPDASLNSYAGQFVSWFAALSTPFLSFNMANDTAIISAIDLFVLNYPEGSISVPNFELYQTPDPTLIEPSEPGVQLVEFDLMNNDQLSQDDLIVRRVTLRPRVPFASPAVLVRWDSLTCTMSNYLLSVRCKSVETLSQISHLARCWCSF